MSTHLRSGIPPVRAWRSLSLPALVLVALSTPAPAAAQLCQGVPLGNGAAAVAGFMGIGDDAGSRAGGSLTYHFDAPLALSGGYVRTRYDGPGTAATSLRAGVAIPARSFGDDNARVSICAAAGAARQRFGDLTVLTVPVGVAAGLTLPLAQRLRGVLHVEPRIVFTRSDVAGFSSSRGSPGLSGGASLVWRGLFAGATHEWVRARTAGSATSLSVGVRIGGRDFASPVESGRQP